AHVRRRDLRYDCPGSKQAGDVCAIFELLAERIWEMKTLSLGLALLASVLVVDAALALTASEQRGLVFARTNCSQCHSIDPVGPSPLPPAPPFRDLHERYPVEDLQESLAEGIR